MYQRLDECPICKHTLLTNEFICKDHAGSQESFALMRCSKCDLLLTNPRPDEQHIAPYYEHNDYISHTNKGNNMINKVYKVVREITLRQKQQFIKSYTSGNRILDFGCGTGTFLKYLQDQQYHVTGTEPAQTPRSLAEQNLGQNIPANPFLLKDKKSFDIITAWHVVEHVHELIPTLKQLKKLLSKNGYMFIAVPNHRSYDASHYGLNWAAYDVPRHLYHFNQSSFQYLAKRLKLTLVSTHPMKFDSYYVSMLSERYHSGHSNLFSAFQVGLKSNLLARRTGEYSSLIYVLTK